MSDERIKYREEFAAQAEKLCLLGATDVELADFFDVTERTINRWKTAHPEFMAAIKDAKDKADARVIRSLYHRAMGYSHPDVHVSNFKGEITVTPIVKHYAPDTTACIFWLKNRQPDDWRDRVEHTGKNGQPIEHQYSGPELARRIAMMLDPRFEVPAEPAKGPASKASH
jgi:hypothetical protein